MKFTFLIAIIFLALNAKAEELPIGCADRTYDCNQNPDGLKKCSWGSDVGKLMSVDLQKTGSGPGYEIWQGNLAGLVKGLHKFYLNIYQRREANRKVNYLTAKLSVDGITAIGQGENSVEVRHLVEATSVGFGIRCSTDISPAP